jgi:squalene monooxygenase
MTASRAAAAAVVAVAVLAGYGLASASGVRLAPSLALMAAAPPLWMWAATALLVLAAASWAYKLNEQRLRQAAPSTCDPAAVAADSDGLPADCAHDVIVVGAGIAGAAMAAYLGRAGKRVLLLERDLSEPERIVGELLQPGGVNKLKEMGMEDCLEGFDAQRVRGYNLHLKGRDIVVIYPSPDGTEQTGRGFHNGRFIMKLRARARAEKTVEVREATVLKLLEHKGRVTGVTLRSKEGVTSEARAPLTIVCDGLFSNLRKGLSAAQTDLKSHFLGVVVRHGKLPFDGIATVVLADPTPILNYPISSTETRILIDFPHGLPSVADGSLHRELMERVLPQIPQGLQAGFIDAVNENRLKSMPNRVMPARPFLVPGAVLLGDALNMRHPLTGGGMTVALTDVANLGQRLAAVPSFADTSAVSAAVEAFYRTRTPPATPINMLSVALYDVFSASNDDLREACFKYLQQGGVFSAGPLSLLSGLSRRQSQLLIHFFGVAFYGVYHTVKPFPTPSKLLRSFHMIRDACRIITPLADRENRSAAISLVCTAMRWALWY